MSIVDHSGKLNTLAMFRENQSDLLLKPSTVPIGLTTMEPASLGDRLDGHKTYLAAFGFAVLGIYKLSDGRWEDAAEMILVALATASLRHAIARKPLKKNDHFLEDHD